MVPPCFEEAEFPLLLEPPPEGLSSLLPHAARPSASTAAAPAASHWLDLTIEHLMVSLRWWAAGSQRTVVQPVTDLWRGCEKRVKAPGRSGSRSRRGCG